jgi:tRNA A58 N-methylase Trm61
MTTPWYTTVLERIEPNSTILDVGIGEGAALMHNSTLLTTKRLQWHGVDIDADYVNCCHNNITKNNLSKSVTVSCESIYDHQGKYDHIYFSGSFMLLPDPIKALQHVTSLLKSSNGKIFFTQTMETNRSLLLEFIKPLLKYFLTIDFGNVTYENEFLELLKKCNMNIIEHKNVESNGLHRSSAKITVVKPIL